MFLLIAYVLSHIIKWIVSQSMASVVLTLLYMSAWPWIQKLICGHIKYEYTLIIQFCLFLLSVQWWVLCQTYNISGKSRYISSVGESKGIFSSLKSEQAINEGMWRYMTCYLENEAISLLYSQKNIQTNIYCQRRREKRGTFHYH